MTEPLASPPAYDPAHEAHQRYCRDRDDEFALRVSFLERVLAKPASGDAADLSLRRMFARVLDVVREVHRQGYCVVHGLLDEDCVERLREGLAPLLAQSAGAFERLAANGPRTAVHIHNVLAKSRAADEVALHPLIRTAMGGLLGFDFLFHAGAIVTAHGPGCQRQPLHRDDASFYALPRPRMPLVITAAVALDDFTRDNGGTRLAPGSCWWMRGREPTEPEVLGVEMSAGSVLIYDGAVFHGGGANTTGHAFRHTLFLNYTRGWLRTQVNHLLAVPRSVVLSLPGALQKDLGYGRSQRALGECDGYEPMDYLRMIERSGDGVQARLGLETAGHGSGNVDSERA